MTVLVVTYDEDGSIPSWRYEVDDDYNLAEGELIADTREVDHRDLGGMRVDVEADPPKLVDDPDFDPRSREEILEERLDEVRDRIGREPVRRDRVSGDSKQELREAIEHIDDDDAREALGHVFEILTGEDP